MPGGRGGGLVGWLIEGGKKWWWGGRCGEMSEVEDRAL